MKRKVLITGATGDTGRAAIKESIRRGLDVRAMIHVKDDRSAALEKLGADIVIGDLHQIDTIRHAMEGTDAAYFVYPVQPGSIEATVNFAQAAKDAAVAAVVNLSQRSANRTSVSHSCRDSWIAERSSIGRACLSPIFAPPTSSSGCSNYDSPPLPSLLVAFKERDAITACFDEEGQYMLEGTSEPAVGAAFHPQNPEEVRQAIRIVERFVMFNHELFQLVEDLQELC